MSQLFNRNLLKIHRDRATLKLHDHDFLVQFSSEDIMERIDSMTMAPDNILDLGARSGILTNNLLTKYPEANLTACDISDQMLSLNCAKNKLLLDEEAIDFAPKSFSLITSVLNTHWINDLPLFLKKISQILTGDGVFIASLFGGTTLKNLRKAIIKAEIASNLGHAAHISPFANADDIYRLLQQAGFAFVVVDSQKIEVEYESPFDLMRDLQDMGEANNLTEGAKVLPKSVLQQLSLASTESFIDNFEIITLTCSKSNAAFTCDKDDQN
jgi:NADH dehydrogenase [ubiquinone] 1 alpha subcomplex assembly factor 5